LLNLWEAAGNLEETKRMTKVSETTWSQRKNGRNLCFNWGKEMKLKLMNDTEIKPYPDRSVICIIFPC